jgi:hypothetical protein
MTADIVNWFKAAGIRVMVSIGGITYTDAWSQALAQNATLLGQKAAALATQLGVGVEIDYEANTNANLAGLQSFITAYRSIHPYDATGADPTARLTIDTAAGDRWLIGINQKATADWLRTDVRCSTTRTRWSRPPAERELRPGELAGAHRREAAVQPARRAARPGEVHRLAVPRRGFAGPPGVHELRGIGDESHADYVQRVLPNPALAGRTPGLLGFMFWAAERPSTRA